MTATAQLIALRKYHTGSLAITHHINLAIKQLAEFQMADPADRPMLAGLIRQTMTELSNLLPGEK